MSVAGTLAAVDVKDNAGYEAGPFEIEDGVGDVGNLAETADGGPGAAVEASKEFPYIML
jgi:hypothetical protein